MPVLSTTPATDLDGFRGQLEKLIANGDQVAIVGAVMTLVEQMAHSNHQLAVRLQAALRQLYRPKSEKVSAEQLALFLAQLPALETKKTEVAMPPVEVISPPSPPPKKKPAGKQPFPPNLRREVKEVLVPEALRNCDLCGGEKTSIGYESQAIWEFSPAEFFLVEERREKIACKPCQEGVVVAEGSAKPLDGARPGPGLLAQIVTSKYRDAVPLYRQSDIYERSGIHLAPSTLGDWIALAAELLEPIYLQARKDALGSYLISTDDTGMPVLDADHPRGIKRGHLWTYIGDRGRVAFCEYTPDWKGVHPRAVLAEFSGRVVQSDGYAGLNEYFDSPGAPIRAGCMDHARRKFVAALEAGDARAAVPVSLFRQLYAVEREAREAGDDFDALLTKRTQTSRPLMDRLHEVIAELVSRAPPKTPLGKAVTYAVNQWPTLIVFLSDARVPVSNAHVERQQRRTALGRKNYLFAGSDEGANRLAVLMTCVVNCELAGAKTFEYLRSVIALIAGGFPNARLAELLPAAWLANQPRQDQ